LYDSPLPRMCQIAVSIFRAIAIVAELVLLGDFEYAIAITEGLVR